jgi:hypothetical protein
MIWIKLQLQIYGQLCKLTPLTNSWINNRIFNLIYIRPGLLTLKFDKVGIRLTFMNIITHSKSGFL